MSSNHISEFYKKYNSVGCQFAVMLYKPFFLSAARRKTGNDHQKKIFQLITSIWIILSGNFWTTASILKLTFIIAVSRAFLGTDFLHNAELNEPLVWGVLMFGLSIVPAIVAQ